MAIYQCGKCGKLVRNSTTPENSLTCENRSFHQWQKITDNGDNTFECSKCGLTIERCSSTPVNTLTCENRSFHHWHNLSSGSMSGSSSSSSPRSSSSSSSSGGSDSGLGS